MLEPTNYETDYSNSNRSIKLCPNYWTEYNKLILILIKSKSIFDIKNKCYLMIISLQILL